MSFNLNLNLRLSVSVSLLLPPPRTFENLEIATIWVETWALASGYRIVPPRGKQPDSGKRSIRMMCEGMKKSDNDLKNDASLRLDDNNNNNNSIRKDKKLQHPNVKSRKIACPSRLTLLLKMGIWHVDISNPSHNHGRLPEPASSGWPGRK
ncbi:hypothetical protein EMCG_05829 [[Emmonsia] crescens]|uniref:FAR1 domain-containing protein n=1 Tax=[Emmonsia] crescens TaxID=73230 RepID=A0A0G2ID85_9EURO|nr:hypothetical protein EMCG_05829 [Emmonsia crescens UAMH 3008]